MKKELSNGLRKYIRKQKMIIRKAAHDKEQERRLIKELLARFYR